MKRLNPKTKKWETEIRIEIIIQNCESLIEDFIYFDLKI